MNLRGTPPNCPMCTLPVGPNSFRERSQPSFLTFHFLGAILPLMEMGFVAVLVVRLRGGRADGPEPPRDVEEQQRAWRRRRMVRLPTVLVTYFPRLAGFPGQPTRPFGLDC